MQDRSKESKTGIREASGKTKKEMVNEEAPSSAAQSQNGRTDEFQGLSLPSDRLPSPSSRFQAKLLCTILS